MTASSSSFACYALRSAPPYAALILRGAPEEKEIAARERLIYCGGKALVAVPRARAVSPAEFKAVTVNW